MLCFVLVYILTCAILLVQQFRFGILPEVINYAMIIKQGNENEMYSLFKQGHECKGIGVLLCLCILILTVVNSGFLLSKELDKLIF